MIYTVVPGTTAVYRYLVLAWYWYGVRIMGRIIQQQLDHNHESNRKRRP